MLSEKELFLILTDNDKPETSDAVIFLEGDGFNRVSKSCDLVKSGLAPVLVFSGGITDHGYGSYPYLECLPKILEQGLSEDCIIWESTSQHTREEAWNVLDLVEKHSWKKIILVATHYHQYRAFLTFLRVMEERNKDRELILYNAPAKGNWFESNPYGRRIDILENEFKKIDFYQQNRQLSSFNSAIEYYKWRMCL